MHCIENCFLIFLKFHRQQYYPQHGVIIVERFEQEYECNRQTDDRPRYGEMRRNRRNRLKRFKRFRLIMTMKIRR